MVRRAETRKQKRSAPDRSSKSPRDPAPPAAKRPLTGPAEPAGPPGVELSAGALAAIQQLVENGQSAVISAFELKFERMERRLNVLESELMDRELEVQKINEQLRLQTQANVELRAQVESIDLNRRLSSLILTCDDFAQRSQNENIEEKVTLVLNERIPALNLTVTEIHVAHRLQRDDKVIVKFTKRSTRDRIYDARFGLTSYSAGATVVRLGAGGSADTRGGRRPGAPIHHGIAHRTQPTNLQPASSGTEIERWYQDSIGLQPPRSCLLPHVQERTEHPSTGRGCPAADHR